MTTWTIIGETGTADGGDGAGPVLAATDLTTVTGWAVKPEGWCRGDECIPASLIGETASNQAPTADEVATALGAAYAVDDDQRIVVVGARTPGGAGPAAGVAPDVEMITTSGERRGLFDDGHDKTLVVAFASWCGCRYDLPGWDALRGELADAGFGVVGVAIDESTDDAAPWAEPVDFPVLVDTDRMFADAYGLVNVPAIIWVDNEHHVVRQPSVEFSDDAFTSVHGVESGPHLDAVRRWVRDDELPAANDTPPVPAELSADQRQARAEFRLAVELRRRGFDEAANARLAVADALAPDDFTIWRAGMQLAGDDPFGAEFFERYTDWQQRFGGPLKVD